MSIWFYIISVAVFVILIYLILKLILIKKSMKEIKNGLKEILESDTNNLITISSNDKEIEGLVKSLNIELRKLRKQRLQYENGNQELKETITNISHDMRTPLTAISGYIDLLKEDNGKKQEYLEIIERKTNDLINLTEQLFNFSKTIDIGVEFNKESCCLNEILEETLASYYNIFNEAEIVPVVEICKVEVYKRLNRSSVIRIFENILSNVSKYGKNGFKVILNEDGKIIFSNKASSLDSTTVNKIFDRYFTVENAKKANGLGLSIAKQLVELNGGKIFANYINGELVIEIEW